MSSGNTNSDNRGYMKDSIEGSRITNKYLVVLTAAVTQSVKATIQRSDPATRRVDYENALSFWLRIDDDRLRNILFLENSGANLSFVSRVIKKVNLFNKNVEIIQTPTRTIPDGLHYGWAELRMLDEGIERSTLAKTSSHFIKATGRLMFLSISRLLNRIPATCDALVDCRVSMRSGYGRRLSCIGRMFTHKKAYSSTQLAIFSARLYQQQLSGMCQQMKPYSYPRLSENILYETLIHADPSYALHYRFPISCDPVGYGACLNVNYDSRAKRAVRSLRSVLRDTVFGHIWI